MKPPCGIEGHTYYWHPGCSGGARHRCVECDAPPTGSLVTALAASAKPPTPAERVAARGRVYDQWRQELFNSGDQPPAVVVRALGALDDPEIYQAFCAYVEERDERERAIWEDAYTLAQVYDEHDNTIKMLEGMLDEAQMEVEALEKVLAGRS